LNAPTHACPFRSGGRRNVIGGFLPMPHGPAFVGRQACPELIDLTVDIFIINTT